MSGQQELSVIKVPVDISAISKKNKLNSEQNNLEDLTLSVLILISGPTWSPSRTMR